MRRVHSALIVVAALLGGVTAGFVRGEAQATVLPPSSFAVPVPIANAETTKAAIAPAEIRPKASAPVVRSLGWGNGPGQIGLARDDEAHGETSLRLAAAADGIAMLDDENHRIVRMAPDGSFRADIRLGARAKARDVAIAKDGSFYVLEGEDENSRVGIFASDGASRGNVALPPEVAKTSRSVLVSGSDVFVESTRGEVTRLGDVSPVPGLPMRDGHGWLTARITSARKGTLHVYVVEKGSDAQRFSREIRPRLFVESIPLIDSDANGIIYVVVSGPRDAVTVSTLLCIEPEHGEVVGSVDLPVRFGSEVILDGKALDAGGIVYSVFTKDGIRLEQQGCP